MCKNNGTFLSLFFPKHRNVNYSGFSSSIYLGCFITSILKDIRFNEKEDILSEDSLIALNDFLERGLMLIFHQVLKLHMFVELLFLIF